MMRFLTDEEFLMLTLDLRYVLPHGYVPDFGDDLVEHNYYFYEHSYGDQYLFAKGFVYVEAILKNGTVWVWLITPTTVQTMSQSVKNAIRELREGLPPTTALGKI